MLLRPRPIYVIYRSYLFTLLSKFFNIYDSGTGAGTATVTEEAGYARSTENANAG